MAGLVHGDLAQLVRRVLEVDDGARLHGSHCGEDVGAVESRAPVVVGRHRCDGAPLLDHRRRVPGGLRASSSRGFLSIQVGGVRDLGQVEVEHVGAVDLVGGCGTAPGGPCALRA